MKQKFYLFIYICLTNISFNITTCRLYEVKDERHAEAFWNRVSLVKEDALPLGERVAALHHNSRIRNDVKLGHGGSRQISFITGSSS